VLLFFLILFQHHLKSYIELNLVNVSVNVVRQQIICFADIILVVFEVFIELFQFLMVVPLGLLPLLFKVLNLNILLHYLVVQHLLLELMHVLKFTDGVLVLLPHELDFIVVDELLVFHVILNLN
jgi:hypothetical protein